MQDSLFKQYQGIYKETEEEGKNLLGNGGREFEYSPFALQDAVGAKDAKAAWLEYVKLRMQGIEVEALIPNIISKARDVLAIQRGASQADLSIKNSYPYNKSKKDVKNWPAQDLENFYTNLVRIYHESRMGGEELEIALEKAILNL